MCNCNDNYEVTSTDELFSRPFTPKPPPAKDPPHGQVFFASGDIKGEVILTHEQGEELMALVTESNVLSDANINGLLGLGEEVVLTISGWTFSSK